MNPTRIGQLPAIDAGGFVAAFLPPSVYRDNDFLVLDDTVYHGKQMLNHVDTLLRLGVSKDRITTAALVVHEESLYKPDHFHVKMRHQDYVAWKEALACLVRHQKRPVDRDHPLYYFDLLGLSSGRLLSILKDYGHIHSVGGTSTPSLSNYTLTIDSSVLSELGSFRSIDLDSFSCRVRFYWEEELGVIKLTVAPTVFVTVRLNEFMEYDKAAFCDVTSLPTGFFDEFLQDAEHSQHIVYYYVSRALAGALLRCLMKEIVPRLFYHGGNLSLLPPELVDGAVQYVFSDSYLYFYSSVSTELKKIIEEQAGAAILPLCSSWVVAKPSYPPWQPEVDDIPRIPRKYSLLEFLTRSKDSAVFDGRRWLPRSDGPAIPYNAFVKEFGDPAYVSEALDDLLDAGLLRAEDRLYDTATCAYAKVFLSGGEYNAIQASSIADTVRANPVPVQASFKEEEALELWGPE